MKGVAPTRATIDLHALDANLTEARRHARGREVVAVVKADAYGHGAVAVARRLAQQGVRRFAVMTLGEAAELREAGLEGELLLLGGVHDAAAASDALSLRATPVLQHPAQCTLLAEAARERAARLAVHVEVDTGMRRMGIAAGEAAMRLAEVAREPALQLAGTYTHLACADETDLASCREQLRRFGEVLAAARAQGIDPGLVHVSNSAGLLAGALEADMPEGVGAVRPGLMLYGVRPAPHLEAALRPVMTLRTRVVNLRALAAGEAVGYGASWRAPAAGRLATLPLGYADGVPWSLASRGTVVHRGKAIPIAGRISMDLVTVWLGEGEVEIGDEVVVFGASDPAAPVEALADAAGTIAYELLVRVGRRVPREVVA